MESLLLNACLKNKTKKTTCVVAISASFDFNPYRSLLVICFEGRYMFTLMTKSLSHRLLTGSSCWWTNMVKEMACYKSSDQHHIDESLTKRISPHMKADLCCTVNVFIQTDTQTAGRKTVCWVSACGNIFSCYRSEKENFSSKLALKTAS